MREAPLAVCTADWHLCLKPPVARSTEPDWLKTQRGYLDQVFSLARKYDVPVLHAGDVLDRWNSPPELINFCLEVMEEVWAVPGNHELPNHSLAEVHRSAYWTLVQAGKVRNLTGSVTFRDRLRVWGFPWGVEPTPCPEPHDLYVEVCLCHKYMWTKGTGYPGAPESGRVSLVRDQFKGYDFVVSGDNHQSFCVAREGTTFVNAGSLMRRTSDQIDFLPGVWLVFGDNTVERVDIDVSGDRFVPTGKEPQGNPLTDFREFSQALRDVRGDTLDFDEALERVIRDGRLTDGTVKALRELTR